MSLFIIGTGIVFLQVVIVFAVSGAREAILAGQLNLKQEIERMSTNLDRIEAATTKLSADVENVKTAINGLKEVVKDLQSQVAAGQLDQSRLDAAASKLEGIDSQLDEIAPDTPTPTP